MKKPFDPVEDSVVPKSLKTLGLIIKITLAVGLILMLGWFTLRACCQEGTKKMKNYMWTEGASEQYDSGSLTVRRLMEYNDPDLSRLFYIGKIYHTKELDQLQFMLRYNALSEHYKELGEGGTFTFELVATADGAELARYNEYCYIEDEALMYRYFRIAFEGVDTLSCDGIQVIIYYNIDGSATEIGRCIVFDREAPSETFKLSGKDARPTKGIVYSKTNEE